MSIEIPKDHLDYLQTYLAQPAAHTTFDKEVIEKISEWVLKRTALPMDGQDTSNLVKYALIVTDCHMQSSLRSLISDIDPVASQRSHEKLRARLEEFLLLLKPKH